jgi:hypothetical protein
MAGLRLEQCAQDGRRLSAYGSRIGDARGFVSHREIGLAQAGIEANAVDLPGPVAFLQCVGEGVLRRILDLRLFLLQFFEVWRRNKVHRKKQIARRLIAEPCRPIVGDRLVLLQHLPRPGPVPHTVVAVEDSLPDGETGELPRRRGARRIPRQNDA